MLRIAIAGATGRMGRMLIETLSKNPALQLGAASVLPDAPALGKDIGTLCGMAPLGVVTVADLRSVTDQFDTLIDFTSPAATLARKDGEVRTLRNIMYVGSACSAFT